jgi:signal peptide peptidase SppA
MPLFQRGPIVPVLRFTGPIGMVTPLRPGLALATTARGIERAFRMSSTPAVAMLVNSPGGSPVQSHLIFTRIRALAAETKKKVYVFTEDVAASGGYFLAVAGDEIYADPSSVIGSIGVISAGFGLDKFIQRFGIERRVHTAGEKKLALDPFSPEKPEDIARLKAIQRDVHETFIGVVKQRRSGRLRTESDLFTGEFWSGAKAVELGLVDGLGEIRTKMKSLFGDKVRLPIVPFERQGWLRRRLGMQGGNADLSTLPETVLSAIETRALWSRYGI